MAKKSIIGICALCGRENIKLMQSHIIPKLIYKRIKSYPNSRFRNLNDLNAIMQDGEKKPILCYDCEECFSKYEVFFTNKYLDKYLKSNTSNLPDKNIDIDNYIISVAWRMIYDDLYNLNSFANSPVRSTYELFEKRLKKYLNQIRTDGIEIVHKPLEQKEPLFFEEMIAQYEEIEFLSNPEKLKNIDTYIFTLKELGYNEDIIKLLDAFSFGYSANSENLKLYSVFSVYNGLVIITAFWNVRAALYTSKIREMLQLRKSTKTLKKFIIHEINYEINEIKKNYS